MMKLQILVNIKADLMAHIHHYLSPWVTYEPKVPHSSFRKHQVGESGMRTRLDDTQGIDDVKNCYVPVTVLGPDIQC